MQVKRFAAHGPMIEDPKNGSYVRLADYNHLIRCCAEMRDYMESRSAGDGKGSHWDVFVKLNPEYVP